MSQNDGLRTLVLPSESSPPCQGGARGGLDLARNRCQCLQSPCPLQKKLNTKKEAIPILVAMIIALTAASICPKFTADGRLFLFYSPWAKNNTFTHWFVGEAS